MADIKFHEVTALPGTLEAFSVYFVKTDAPFCEIYVTGAVGTDVRRSPNTADIQALIDAAAPSGASALELVADIAARDALTLTANALVLVYDASADPTVTSGGAFYGYRHSDTSFTKFGEIESMDVVLDWSNIQNRPTSSVTAIDAAVTASHGHTNKTQLDQIGQDGGGNLTYGGTRPTVEWATTAW